ncbi:hypothetical protein AGLY_018264 [Aphis glycines]|uniref:Uncharacterized protein n=1 Tax=Aphis glycines TaxID=307491 RepID=A0A6G0ST60_APHGL|nr:hypothetical protein AGLY_018264 [Aphis glycines]
MFTFNGYKHQGHSICSRKPPSKLVIGAFFRLFFFVYLNYFENCWEMFTFNGYKHQGHSIAVENHPQNLPFSVLFFLVYVNYYENCWELFTFNGYKNQGHSICSRKPPSKFVIGAFFRLICRFRSFFLFISIILKTVGKCSLLTVISIKDIRVAVENHPHTSRTFDFQSKITLKVCNRSILSTSYVVQRNKKKKFQKSINNSKNTYLFENPTIHR